VSRDDAVVAGAESVVDATVYGDDGTVRVDPLVPPDYHPEKAVSVELGGSWGVASVALDEAESRSVAASVVAATQEGASGSAARSSRPGYEPPEVFVEMESGHLANRLRSVAAQLSAEPADERTAWDAVVAAAELWQRAVDEADEAPEEGGG
jgi:hypothetical protein